MKKTSNNEIKRLILDKVHQKNKIIAFEIKIGFYMELIDVAIIITNPKQVSFNAYFLIRTQVAYLIAQNTAE